MIPTPTESFLGDSTILPIPLLDAGRPFNPAGWHLIFTLKSSGLDPDTAALIQKDSNNGITTAGTTAFIEFVPQDSATADPGLYVYDIQAQNLSTSAVRTVALGQHTFRRDLTRATTTSVPIYTTAPGVPGLIPVILRTEAQGPPDGSVPAIAIGQLCRVGDETPFAWYRWDGEAWEDIAAVTSVAISATGLSVSGSPITTSGTITLAVLYGTTSGTACAGNDSRLSNARTPTAHKSTHATGGSDALSPADIGAVATSALSTTATANSVVQRDGSGGIQVFGVMTEGILIEDGTGPTVLAQPGLLQVYDGSDVSQISPTRAEFGGEVEAVGPVSSPYLLTGNNWATAISGATVTVTVADHQGRWLPLTGSSGTQTITMPSATAGAEFIIERRGAAELAFDSGFTVTANKLADVPVGGVFGMKCVSASPLTYLFI